MAKISIDLKEGKIAEAKKEEAFIIGIDLGTTNSLVAYVEDGKPVLISDTESNSKALLPSIVYFAAEGEIVVGDAAKKRLVEQPERTIFSVKRLMGKSYNDVANYQENIGYQIIDEDEEKLVKVRVGNAFYTPIELSAHILRALKKRVEMQTGRIPTQAVITVPAYFNDAQRQATRDAGKLAGLDVLRIVNEPTAASLAYGMGLDREQQQTIAVYDLGGGTFDLSILQLEYGIFEVLATQGNTFLGGDDIDRLILEHWLADDQVYSKKDRQKFRLAAEEAKIHLSDNAHFETQINGKSYKLSRLQFEELIQPVVQQTLDHCKAALKDAGLNPTDIDEVVMVGGSTRIPSIKQAVAQFFGRDVHDALNPDEVVAIGAAIQADVLAGNRKDLLLLDVTPLSLGIETMGGLMDVIIPRNNKIPCSVGRQYTTSVDGQVNLKISVFQGERDLVADNRKLGEFILSDIPPMPAGLPKIEVQFIIDADGLLQVKAQELRSGVSQQISIKSQYGISEEDMALMLMDSLRHAESDMQQRSLLEATNEAKHVLLSTKKFTEQHQGLLTAEELKQLQEHTQSLQLALDQSDKDGIEARMQELNTFAAPLAHRAMDAVVADSLKGKEIR